MPPGSEPGPTSVLHRYWPVRASSAQYTPLFWPMPTIERRRPSIGAAKMLAPAPAKSHTENGVASQAADGSGPGHQVTLRGSEPHASWRASAPAPRNDQRIRPVCRSKATTELKCASREKQLSLQRVATAARHAVTSAGCV